MVETALATPSRVMPRKLRRDQMRTKSMVPCQTYTKEKQTALLSRLEKSEAGRYEMMGR